MTDDCIVELFWQRNEAALREAEEKYGTACRAAAQNILNSAEDAEECFSDALYRTWNAVPPQRPDDLRAYLLKLTRRAAFDRYKAARAEKRGGGQLPAVLDELAECLGSGGVEEAVLAAELSAAVNRFLHRLPQREAGVFLRRYFFAEEAAVIGQRYGMTANHVAVLLSRVREKLRRHLRKEGLIP